MGAELRGARGGCTGEANLGRGIGRHYFDVRERPALQRQGLCDGLLGTETRGEVDNRERMCSCIRPLVSSKEARSKRRPPLQRTFEPSDLEDVNPDHAASLPRQFPNLGPVALERRGHRVRPSVPRGRKEKQR
jgi:hypothetical protein